MDTPLDSIGADGEFSDINQYLLSLQVNSSTFSDYGFKSTSFDEVNTTNQGIIRCSFSMNTKNDSDFLSNHIPQGYDLVPVVKLSSSISNGTYSSGYSILELFDVSSVLNRYGKDGVQAGSFSSSNRISDKYSLMDSFVIPLNDENYLSALNSSYIRMYVTFNLKLKSNVTFEQVYNLFFVTDDKGTITSIKKNVGRTGSVHLEIKKR